MIECTLQEAVKRCKENGGRFYLKDAKTPCFYKITTDGHIITNDNGYVENMKIWVAAFESTWIYEPPKQSAFQKWYKTEVCSVSESDDWRVRLRKEGWNAAIDAVFELEEPVSDRQNYRHVRVYKIKELKEG